jgi:hypothetical protein
MTRSDFSASKVIFCFSGISLRPLTSSAAVGAKWNVREW